MSNYLNKRETYLDSDFTESNVPATQYDTDLENFWTQTSINEILITENRCLDCILNELNEFLKTQLELL